MLGLIFLTLLGGGLIVDAVRDDDDDDVTETSTANAQSDEPAGSVPQNSASSEAVRLVGSNGPDSIELGSGNDTVVGRGGDDTLLTGAGDDTIFGGGGEDLIVAGEGNDRAFGGAGEDAIIGSAGNDFLRGGASDDVITADAGNDTLFGDAGDDILDGTEIFDNEGLARAFLAAERAGTILTDAQTQAFFDIDRDNGEADTLNGGVGEDAIFAGNNDEVTTGLGSDQVILGDWIDPTDAGAVITDFNPAEDAIVYIYDSAVPTDVFFSEDDSGTLTLETNVSESNTAVLATLRGLTLSDVSSNNLNLISLI